jgi:hypothetical protein
MSTRNFKDDWSNCYSEQSPAGTVVTVNSTEVSDNRPQANDAGNFRVHMGVAPQQSAAEEARIAGEKSSARNIFKVPFAETDFQEGPPGRSDPLHPGRSQTNSTARTD